MEAAGLFPVFTLLALVFRLMAGGLDGPRVEDDVRQQVWELVDRSWDPSGPGWSRDKGSGIDQIV